MKNIVIIDYGCGNIKSLLNSFNFLNLNAIATNEKNIIKSADYLVLPGVGAFPAAIKVLKEQKLDEIIKDHFFKKKPLLGICLGMQLMLELGNELESTKGLNLIKGSVEKLPLTETKKSKFTIPNIGWYNLEQNNLNNPNIFKVNKSKRFYFIHSYYCNVSDKTKILHYTNFNDFKFCSSFYFENLIGFQFHPEKSRESGLNLIKSFTDL